MLSVLSIGRIDQRWQNLDVGFSRLVLKWVGSMPSLSNFASVYFVMIMSSKMNTTSFSHVACIMTCDLLYLIAPDRMFPILPRWTLMIKWYIWCHAMRLKNAEFVFRAMEMRRSVLHKMMEHCAVIICTYNLTLHVSHVHVYPWI